jgi:AraC family carnitine catabolism transcriptional activator
MNTLHLNFCLLPRLPLFGLVSALEVLRHANRMAETEVYRWSFLTETGDGVQGSNGMWLQPSSSIKKAANAERVFMVAGFEPWAFKLPKLGKWMQQQAGLGATLGGISNGGFPLAALGLLDGFAATVHWEDFSTFYESYPQVKSRYQRFVIDGSRMTCSGGASTLALFIEMVRADLGEDIARRVSRQMSLGEYPVPEGDSNTATDSLPFADGRRYSPQVQRVLSLLDAGIEGQMTVAALAAKVGVSRRELLRLLQRETGQTPSQIITARRLERAQSLVRHSHLPLAAVADAVGFSSQSHLTLRYRQHYGVTPAQHRRA